ncbi:MAG: endolytic transglycosylase MltG [Blastomonas sp.]
MLRKLGCLILVLALFGAAFVGGNFVLGWTGDGPAKEEMTFVVPSGTSLAGAAELLEKAGAIKSASAFLQRAKIFGGSEPIKAGEFLIPAGASNSQILRILQGTDVIQRLVTIPEGMPSVLVQEKLMAEDMMTGDIPVPAEGSVLPESYSFERGQPRAKMLIAMQDAMKRTLDELWEKRSPDTVAKTPREAIILASIVEKETGKPSERRMIAGVYSNRLRKGMMLQADPTIIYPITRGKPLGRRIRQSEIQAVNDYNTYAMTGLPKGPITNPGRASIEAVLNPARTEALFFVADGTGGHVFSNTLEEHNRNVEKWFNLRRQRGEM